MSEIPHLPPISAKPEVIFHVNEGDDFEPPQHLKSPLLLYTHDACVVRPRWYDQKAMTVLVQSGDRQQTPPPQT